MMVEAEIVYEATFDRGPGIWKNNVKYYKDFWGDLHTFGTREFLMDMGNTGIMLLIGG